MNWTRRDADDMPNAFEQALKAHEVKDAEQFDALGDSIKELTRELRAMRQDFCEHREEMKPIGEAWNTAKNTRNGIMWIATLLIAVGGAVAVIKGLFK